MKHISVTVKVDGERVAVLRSNSYMKEGSDVADMLLKFEKAMTELVTVDVDGLTEQE